MGYVKMILPVLQKDINLFKRSVGIPLKDAPQQCLIALYSHLERCKKEDENAVYIKSGEITDGLDAIWTSLCIYSLIKTEYEKSSSHDVSVGEALRKCKFKGAEIKKKKDGTEMTKDGPLGTKVESLLRVSDNSNGSVTRNLGTLVKLNPQAFYCIDIYSLVKDLNWFNSGRYPAKKRWAMDVYIKENNSDVINEEQEKTIWS